MKLLKALKRTSPIHQKNMAQMILLIAASFFPLIAFGSVESSLGAIQSKLVGTILPLCAMLGLVIAGLSFVAGHQNARQHLVYAVIGAIIGFGSESIVSFIRGMIN